MFLIVGSLIMLFMAFFSVRVLFGADRVIIYTGLLFVMMYLAVIARKSIAKYGHSDLLMVVAWLGYVSIGVVSMLFCAAVVKLVINIAGFTLTHATESFSPSRRAFLSTTAGSLLSLAVLPMTGYGVYRAVGRPEIVDVAISKDGLPKALDGLRIVQISDVHVGPTIGAGTVERAVEMINSLNPDIIAITGDLVDGSADYLSDRVTALGGLKSKYGAYFVTGNHEYYSGADGWIETVRELGINVLNNSNAIIEHNGAKLMIAGIPDIQSERFGHAKYNPARAKITDEQYDYSIILSHRPEIADEVAKHGYDLQLSGHTHGGQYFPWTLVIYAFHKYVKGLYKVGDMNLYINKGTAYWGPPLRLGAQSEITCLTLKGNQNA
jgi:predicted MPP superfamily phosphohydrolase